MSPLRGSGSKGVLPGQSQVLTLHDSGLGSEAGLLEGVFPKSHTEPRLAAQLGDAFADANPPRIKRWELAVIGLAKFPVSRDKPEMDLGVKAEFRAEIVRSDRRPVLRRHGRCRLQTQVPGRVHVRLIDI